MSQKRSFASFIKKSSGKTQEYPEYFYDQNEEFREARQINDRLWEQILQLRKSVTPAKIEYQEPEILRPAQYGQQKSDLQLSINQDIQEKQELVSKITEIQQNLKKNSDYSSINEIERMSQAIFRLQEQNNQILKQLQEKQQYFARDYLDEQNTELQHTSTQIQEMQSRVDELTQKNQQLQKELQKQKVDAALMKKQQEIIKRQEEQMQLQRESDPGVALSQSIKLQRSDNNQLLETLSRLQRAAEQQQNCIDTLSGSVQRQFSVNDQIIQLTQSQIAERSRLIKQGNFSELDPDSSVSDDFLGYTGASE